MRLKHTLLFVLTSLLLPTAIMAQQEHVHATDSTAVEGGDDLMTMLEDESPAAKPKPTYVTATFKATRVVNGQSIENTGKGVLDFRISHRFGTVNSGFKNFFGLDGATTRLGFDYGITPWLMAGIGRSSYQKEYDGFLKIKLLRQHEHGGMPFSLSYLGGISAQTADVEVPAGREYYFSNRLAFTNQILMARKFSRRLSVQLLPTHIHYNLVDTTSEPNDVLALGVAGRMKLSNRISLTGEYFYQVSGYQLAGTRNSLSFGIDIETGGHVFQLIFSNSIGMTERTVIGQTTGDWSAGDIHFGFNISRVFTIVKPKGFEGSRNKIY
jgi:hypothetical protein